MISTCANALRSSSIGRLWAATRPSSAATEARPPDLVISDLKMPVMDGVTLCREIRKRNSDVEIVFLSAYEDFSTAQLALKYGVRDYILKPLTRDTFRAISELVRSLALARQSHSRIQSLTQPETVAQIRAALQRRDGDAIERLLEPLREHADDDPVQTANLCIFLLQILHGVPRETDFSAYRTQQMELMALPTCSSGWSTSAPATRRRWRLRRRCPTLWSASGGWCWSTITSRTSTFPFWPRRCTFPRRIWGGCLRSRPAAACWTTSWSSG